ncbi:MAG: hypothetical protein AAF378_16190 [Cyanobacteria bacterium P01_A01_bin.84]
MSSVIEQAVIYLRDSSKNAPIPAELVEALIQAEKTAKQNKIRYSYQKLQGNWRLGFITGTKKSRQKAGVVLGAGRFLPKWVEIQISYVPSSDSTDKGQVYNSVQLGLLKIVLDGPVLFYPKMNLLAFDFIYMKLSLSKIKLYQGNIRGGALKDNFYEQSIKKQAFFNYFLVQDNYIAARGKGGGLALWTRVEG